MIFGAIAIDFHIGGQMGGNHAVVSKLFPIDTEGKYPAKKKEKGIEGEARGEPNKFIEPADHHHIFFPRKKIDGVVFFIAKGSFHKISPRIEHGKVKFFLPFVVINPMEKGGDFSLVHALEAIKNGPVKIKGKTMFAIEVIAFFLMGMEGYTGVEGAGFIEGYAIKNGRKFAFLGAYKEKKQKGDKHGQWIMAIDYFFLLYIKNHYL